MVDETMANAARVHAIESGKAFAGRTVIAFGGGGPVHACRVAEKIGADRIMVPPGAGVGSAIGFLRAPVGYEVVRSQYRRLGQFDAGGRSAARGDGGGGGGRGGAGRFGAATRTVRTAFMRYVGQGHEIPVRAAGRRARRGRHAGRVRRRVRPVLRPPGAGVGRRGDELRRPVATETACGSTRAAPPAGRAAARSQPVRDPATGEVTPGRCTTAPRCRRAPRAGPAIIAEDETSTLVGAGWSATLDATG